MQSHRNLRTGSTLLVIVFMLVSVLPSAAQTENPTTVSRILWRIPRNLCHTADDCSLDLRISENNFLYVFNNYDQLLYVFSPGNQAYKRYNLSRFLSWSVLFDFIPFGTDFILFNNSVSGKQIYKYDLANGTFVAIKTQPTVSFNICASMWGFGSYQRSFMRFDSSRLVMVCTASTSPKLYQTIFGIHILNVDTLTLDKVAEFTGDADPPILPHWYRLTAGQNNQVYLQPTGPLREFSRSELIPIWHRSIQDTAWTTLSLSERGLVGWDTGRFAEHTTQYGEVLAVDSKSNLYLDLSWIGDDINGARVGHSRLVKVTQQGNVVWVLREDNILGKWPRLIDVTSEGKLIMLKPLESGPDAYQVEEIEVLAPSPTP